MRSFLRVSLANQWLQQPPHMCAFGQAGAESFDDCCSEFLLMYRVEGFVALHSGQEIFPVSRSAIEAFLLYSVPQAVQVKS